MTSVSKGSACFEVCTNRPSARTPGNRGFEIGAETDQGPLSVSPCDSLRIRWELFLAPRQRNAVVAGVIYSLFHFDVQLLAAPDSINDAARHSRVGGCAAARAEFLWIAEVILDERRSRLEQSEICPGERCENSRAPEAISSPRMGFTPHLPFTLLRLPSV